ncbi:MAG: HAD family phosphatase [Lachnospiraceae bacterium]|nr:HAD family phosphatase [Lachnospiraceae bacterium]
MIEITKSDLFEKGKGGVRKILTPQDKKIDIVEFDDKTLCYVKSGMGYPAIYPMYETYFEPRAEAVLMDLDGTSVHSESFWMWVIEQTTAKLLGKPGFKREVEDEPFISGHSVSEHLQYMIEKYAKGSSLELARQCYFEIVNYEMDEIMKGRGKQDAFTPAPNLKKFLNTLKKEGIKIGLVTSGLYEKAMPEIISAFKQLDMGNPIEFYDAIITAGQALRKGQTGTLGELAPKPHPWLYAETARVGLGIPFERRHKVLGIEDSAAGVVSVKLSGFCCAGITGGNIDDAGVAELCDYRANNLMELLDIIL